MLNEDKKWSFQFSIISKSFVPTVKTIFARNEFSMM